MHSTHFISAVVLSEYKNTSGSLTWIDLRSIAYQTRAYITMLITCLTCLYLSLLVLLTLLSSERKRFKSCLKINVFFLHYSIFNMPRIPNNLRERAIGMLDAGMSTEHVARHVGCSSRAIRNLCIRFRTTGSTNDLPRRRRPRGQNRYIMNTHLRNRF